jgi:hypothetical protein
VVTRVERLGVDALLVIGEGFPGGQADLACQINGQPASSALRLSASEVFSYSPLLLSSLELSDTQAYEPSEVDLSLSLFEPIDLVSLGSFLLGS